MDSAPATALAVAGDEDEWQLQNDDGFVYKCKKRRRCAGDNSSAAGTVSAFEDPQAAEERNRREKKRRILVKLMKRYRWEIDLWEVLSKGLQERGKTAVKDETASFLVSASAVVRETKNDGCGGEDLVDELFLLAETQEEVIHKISSWCDIAEAMCKSETDRLNQLCFDLPIWGSPCELMASLCTTQ